VQRIIRRCARAYGDGGPVRALWLHVGTFAKASQSRRFQLSKQYQSKRSIFQEPFTGGSRITVATALSGELLAAAKPVAKKEPPKTASAALA
jgi:hypothetical protein